jgi:hypothetical protein
MGADSPHEALPQFHTRESLNDSFQLSLMVGYWYVEKYMVQDGVGASKNSCQ